MDTLTLIEQAKGLGLSLTIVDGRLNVTGPKTAAVAALVQRMTPHKEKLIAALATDTDYDTLPYGDLTTWVGHTVDAETWDGLQDECQRRYGQAWEFTAKPVAAGWQVTRFASAGWCR